MNFSTATYAQFDGILTLEDAVASERVSEIFGETAQMRARATMRKRAAEKILFAAIGKLSRIEGEAYGDFRTQVRIGALEADIKIKL